MGTQDPLFCTLYDDLGDDMDEEVVMFINNFVENTLPEAQSNIQSAIDAENWDEARQLVHAIKGTAGGYGYMIISDLLGQTQNALIEGNNTLAVEQIADFHKLCDRVYQGHKQK